MLRSTASLYGNRIAATDGDIGHVQDLFFDDESWCVRYLIVDTGTLLPGKRVLLSVTAADQPAGKMMEIPVRVSMNAVRTAPPISADRPVSRQELHELHTHYGWDPSWFLAGMHYPGAPIDLRVPAGSDDDPHLRSCKEVCGYRIEAVDGAIGHVEDFIIDDRLWIIRYLVIDTRNWLPGKKILFPPSWIDSITWAERQVAIEVTRNQVKQGPEYNPSAPVNRELETQLYDYYGRRRYW